MDRAPVELLDTPPEERDVNHPDRTDHLAAAIGGGILSHTIATIEKERDKTSHHFRGRYIKSGKESSNQRQLLRNTSPKGPQTENREKDATRKGHG